MIRMRRLTDYGIVLLAHLGGEPARAVQRPLPGVRGSPASPTVSKISKALGRAGLLVAHRGVKGGFSLARRPRRFHGQIISAMEGPIAITECSDNVPGICELEPWCRWSQAGRRIMASARWLRPGTTVRARRSRGRCRCTP